jgi:DNA-binding LacI/PurR family transcriptional regulator
MHSIPDQDHKDREEGFVEALKARGLELPEPYIVRVNADLEGGSQALIRLMSLREPPTAVYCTDPLIGVGLLRRALQCGLRVPEELSIIGFDDGDLRRMQHPMLTAVVQNATRLGIDAATWLARMLTQTTEPTFQHTDQTFFEINATTTKPTPEPVRLLPDGSRM